MKEYYKLIICNVNFKKRIDGIIDFKVMQGLE